MNAWNQKYVPAKKYLERIEKDSKCQSEYPFLSRSLCIHHSLIKSAMKTPLKNIPTGRYCLNNWKISLPTGFYRLFYSFANWTCQSISVCLMIKLSLILKHNKMHCNYWSPVIRIKMSELYMRLLLNMSNHVSFKRETFMYHVLYFFLAHELCLLGSIYYIKA